MKSFLKIGSLFALIIAGRYMQLTAPTAEAELAQSQLPLFAPSSTTMMLTHYSTQPTNTITPVNQRAQQQLITWF